MALSSESRFSLENNNTLKSKTLARCVILLRRTFATQQFKELANPDHRRSYKVTQRSIRDGHVGKQIRQVASSYRMEV